MRFLISALLLAGGIASAHAQSYPSPRFNNVTIDGSITGGTVTATGSTTARSLSARFAEVYNVADWGITCDGTVNGVGTDNYAALSALLSSVSSVATATRRVGVYFPPATGRCLLSQKVDIPSYTTVFATPGTVVIAPTPGNTSSPMLFGTSFTTDPRVSGLTIDGGLTYSTPIANANRVFLTFLVSGMVVDNVTFQNTRGIALELSRMSNFELRDSYFNNIGEYWKTSGVDTDRKQAVNFNCGSNIASQYHTNIRLVNNRFNNIGYDPIAFCRVKGGKMEGNTIYNTDQQWATISSSNYPGTYVIYSMDVQVLNHTVDGNPGMCIDIAASSNVVVSGARLANCGVAGIGIQGANITVTGTHVRDVWLAGSLRPTLVQRGCFVLFGSASNVTLSGNYCKDSHTQVAKTTNGSATVELLGDTSFFSAGDSVSGTGISGGTTVSSITDPNTLVMSAPATASNSPVSITIGTPTTQFCFQGVGPTAPSATGTLKNIYIDASNICEGAVATYTTTTGQWLALTTGANY